MGNRHQPKASLQDAWHHSFCTIPSLTVVRLSATTGQFLPSFRDECLSWSLMLARALHLSLNLKTMS